MLESTPKIFGQASSDLKATLNGAKEALALDGTSTRLYQCIYVLCFMLFQTIFILVVIHKVYSVNFENIFLKGDWRMKTSPTPLFS